MSSIEKNTATSATEKDKTRKKFSELPKKKKILWISVGILIILAIVGGILAGVLIPMKKKGNDEVPHYSYRSYYYAVDMEKESSFRLPTDWITSGKMSDFKISNSMPDYVEVKDGAAYLKSLQQGATTLTCVLEFYKEDQKAATINLFFTNADEHITTAAQLRAIPEGSNKTYILDADLDFNGTAFRLNEFRGSFYGNHHTLSRLNISGQSKGGMFGSLVRARVYGVQLTDVRCSFAGSDTTFGVLADEAYRTNIGYCSVSGTASFAPAGGVNRIGGMVGRFYEDAQYEYLDGMQCVMENCVSTLDMNVRQAAGKVSVGGLTGVAENVKLANVRANGGLDVSLDGAGLTDFAYIGGASGQWTRTYKTPLRLRVLDLAYGVTSTGNIKVKVSGDGISNTVFVGGLAGYLSNQQLSGARYAGVLRAESAGWHMSAGGVAGRAENGLIHTNISMSVMYSGIAEQGKLQVVSDGVVWAGGLFGWGKGIRAEEKGNSEYSPMIEGANAQNKTGKIYGYAA